MNNTLLNYYNVIANGYDELYGKEQKNKCTFISTFFFCTKKDTLLDIGCGSGISTIPWNCRVVGIDPSERLITIANKKKTTATFIVSCAEELPFPDSSFTKIISVTAIQNFYDLSTALSEMKRVATPNADIIITCLKASTQKESFQKAIEEQFSLQRVKEDEKETYFICSNVYSNM